MKGKMKLKQNSFLLLVTILLFFIMYGIGCVLFNAQGFSKTQNFLNLFISNAGLIVIGIGMTVVMITGGIDISVGSFVAMGCMMLAWMMEKGGIGAVPAVIIVLALLAAWLAPRLRTAKAQRIINLVVGCVMWFIALQLARDGIAHAQALFS